MQVWNAILAVGSLFRSAQGYAWALGLTPAAVTYALGLFEGLPLAAIAVYFTIALAAGAVLALLFLAIWEEFHSHFLSSKEKRRIAGQLEAYIQAGETYIDTPTAAGIWANTLDKSHIQRHLYFRILKLAIDDGSIRNTLHEEGASKANMRTRIPLVEFQRFLRVKGAID